MTPNRSQEGQECLAYFITLSLLSLSPSLTNTLSLSLSLSYTRLLLSYLWQKMHTHTLVIKSQCFDLSWWCCWFIIWWKLFCISELLNKVGKRLVKMTQLVIERWQNIVITYSWKEEYPQCALLTWGIIIWYEMLRSYGESYIRLGLIK